MWGARRRQLGEHDERQNPGTHAVFSVSRRFPAQTDAVCVSSRKRVVDEVAAQWVLACCLHFLPPSHFHLSSTMCVLAVS